MKMKRESDAESLDKLLDCLSDEWYQSSDGDYSKLPTWGPQTDRVAMLIAAGGPEGDLLSWDTRSPDPAEHRFLRRHLRGGVNEFAIESETDFSE